MRVLHPGVDLPSDVAVHAAVDPCAPAWGWIPPAGAPPAAVARSGTEMVVDLLSHEGMLGDQGRDPVEFFGRHGIASEHVLHDAIELAASDHPHDQALDGPHVMVGPILVEDAPRGGLVGVHTIGLELRVPYGVVTQRPGRGLLASTDLDLATGGEGPRSWVGMAGPRGGTLTGAGGRTLTYPMRPFVGLVATGGAGAVHSTRPGGFGGNLDARRLGVGTTLWLPIQSDGAWVSLGDPHHAQGDGEVAGTAVEGSLRARIRLDVQADAFARRWVETAQRPLGQTPTHWLVPGFGNSVDEAAASAVRAAVDLVCLRTDADPHLALAVVSAAGDLAVTQAVNLRAGAHVLLPRSVAP